MKDNLGAVIEQNTVRAVRELVAQAVLRAEVNEFDNEFGAWLLLRLRDQLVVLQRASTRSLDFC